MCRRITGQSIGLVLGAGGARGLAHLGVIRALNEAGISGKWDLILCHNRTLEILVHTNQALTVFIKSI